MLRVGFSRKVGDRPRAVGLRPGRLFAGVLAEQDRVLLDLALAHVRRRFSGKDDDILSALTPAGWRFVVELGEAEAGGTTALRRLGGDLCALVGDLSIASLDLALGLPAEQAAEMAYGMALRAWRFPKIYRSRPDPEDDWAFTRLTVITDEPEAARAHYRALGARVAGATLARDLVVAPANRLTPASFESYLAPLAERGVTIGRFDAAAHKLPLLEAVGRTSAFAPRLLTLGWQGGQPDLPPIVLIGKGVTFDTGGLGLKDAEEMDGMKGDMAGAAAVAGTLLALALRRAPVNVLGILALAENMVGANAMRPGDVLESHAGLSVEVVDTDAEGRLILADALSFAKRFHPRLIVDLATLTYAVEEAFGEHRAGLFCNDGPLRRSLMAAGEAEDEPLWPLPLTDCYDDALKSAIADLRQCDVEDGPDALHGARFLEHFVPQGVPWAHLDIAGVAEIGEDGSLAAEGPTGFGVRLLDRLIEMDLREGR